MALRKQIREDIHYLLNNDEISEEEAGFMIGYFEE